MKNLLIENNGRMSGNNFELFASYMELNNYGYSILWLDLFSVLSIIFGIFVIITRNPVVSVLNVIALFIIISGYLFLIGMNFIALSYILVYIGAVSILFIFVLMLINVRVSELHSDTRNSLFLSILVGIPLYFSISLIIPSPESSHELLTWLSYSLYNVMSRLIEISLSTSDKWDGNFLPITEISSIGNIIYSSHALWLMIISILLLLAMIGTIVMTVAPTSFNNSIINEKSSPKSYSTMIKSSFSSPN